LDPANRIRRGFVAGLDLIGPSIFDRAAENRRYPFAKANFHINP
jgi:hypothetical protein